MPRICNPDWITSYTTAVAKYTGSPDNYHYWSAATAIAATLKRHVYILRGTWKLRPNLFTILVGRPGIGKDEAINPAVSAIQKASSANILSDRITMEWVKETLSKGFPTTGVGPNGGVTFGTSEASCLIVAPELSVFLRNADEILPDLADLWNSKEGASMYGTRGKGLFTIENPCPSLLGGCAPEWLKNAIPPSAIGGGFTRRVNFVYAKESKIENVWPAAMDWNAVLAPLINDLKQISQLKGEYKFDNLARPVFEKIFKERMDDFTDEATTHYTTSRWANAAKLAMCIAASRSDDLIITRDIIEEADVKTTVVKNELRLVFRSVGSSDIMTAADKVVHYVENVGTCTVQQIMNAVWRDCSRPELDVVLITLRDAGIIDEAAVGGRTVYKSRANANTPQATNAAAAGAAAQPTIRSYGIN